MASDGHIVAIDMQELKKEHRWISEAIFTGMLLTFIVWSFSPLLVRPRRFSVARLYSRVLSVLVGEQNRGWWNSREGPHKSIRGRVTGECKEPPLGEVLPTILALMVR
jgi:hypothetical protein